MRRLRNAIAAALLLSGAGFAAYRMLLSDEAKENLRQAAESVRVACEKICDPINGAQGTVMEGDLPNRERTRNQWRSLGL